MAVTSLIMQIETKTNFFNDIFIQIIKELGKGENFFIFYYGSTIVLAIIYAIKIQMFFTLVE